MHRIDKLRPPYIITAVMNMTAFLQLKKESRLALTP